MQTSKHSAGRAIRTLTPFLLAGLQAALVLNAQPCAPPLPGMNTWGMTNWYQFNVPSPLADKRSPNTLTGNILTVPGKVGTANSFNGTLAGILTATLTNQPSFGPDFSFDAWVNVPAVSNQVQVLVEKRQAAPLLRGWSFYTYKGGLGMQIASSPNNGWNFNSTAQIPLNQWVMIAVVVHRRASRVEFYHNGALVRINVIGAVAKSANVNTNTAMKLGVRTIGNSGYFTGLMDEVELFDRALTPQEIASIYNAGATGKCP